MRHIYGLFIILGLIGCQSREIASLLADNEKEYLVIKLKADSLLITKSFTDYCSTAVFTFYNSRTIQNPPEKEDSPFEPQWDYNLDLFKEVDSMLMSRKININSVDLRYETDNKEIYKLTINKTDCSDTLKAIVRK